MKPAAIRVREVGQKYTFGYNDCRLCEDGWIDPTRYRPFPYDLVELGVHSSSHAKKITSIFGWWTGSRWDGKKIKQEAKVDRWRTLQSGNLREEDKDG